MSHRAASARNGFAKAGSRRQDESLAAPGAQDERQRDSLTDLALQSRDIREIRPFISFAMEDIDQTQLPEPEVKHTPEPYVAPERTPIAFHWMASNLHHNPLYFEDPSLERYGHTYHPMVQPFMSAGRFTTQLVGLPYQMTIDPLHKRQYTLGWIRPGDCAPKKHYQIPLNKRAAAVQAGVMTGAFYIFP